MVKATIEDDFDFDDGNWETGLEIGDLQRTLAEAADKFTEAASVLAEEAVRANLATFRDSLGMEVASFRIPEGDIQIDLTEDSNGDRVGSCLLKPMVDELVDGMLSPVFADDRETRAEMAKSLLAVSDYLRVAADKLLT